jgi:hypothetical protein
MTLVKRALPAAVDRELRRLLSQVASSRATLRTLCQGPAPAGTRAGLDAISHWLYQHWYLVPAVAPGPAGSSPPHPNLAAALRAALPASTRWQRGWTVLESGSHGTCVAARRGQARELRCGEYASLSRPGVPVMPGDGVAVMECVDWVDWHAGFWTTRSAAGEPAAPLVRVYWSVSEARAAAIIRRVAGSLDDLQVRYSMKCPVRSADFARVDSLVVYLERPDWSTIRKTVLEIARRSRADLRPSSPPLTQSIAAGVSCADDPGPSESFGQSRCRALAAGVLDLLEMDSLPIDGGGPGKDSVPLPGGGPGKDSGPAHDGGLGKDSVPLAGGDPGKDSLLVDDSVAVLAAALRKAGIDPGRPWRHSPV